MSKTLNPGKYFSGHESKVDPDADWMQVAERVPAITHTAKIKSLRYIPAFPLSFLLAIAPAKDAVIILLLMLSEMRMQKITEYPIDKPIWDKAGIKSKRIRGRLLSQIGLLPECVCRLIPRKGRPHLLVVGSDWPKPLNISRKPP
jgi:hypothetical protein